MYGTVIKHMYMYSNFLKSEEKVNYEKQTENKEILYELKEIELKKVI